MHVFFRIAASAAIFSLGGMASAQALSPQEFADQAVAADQFELRSSQMALDLSKDEKVRTFAQDMLRDHGKSAQELSEAAKADKAQVRQQPAPDADEQLDQLKNKSGKDFDQAYLAAQIAAHEKAIALFDSYAKDGQAGSLKTFAKATFPTLRMHLVRLKGMTGKE
jgi:putative membrane protein